MRDFVNEAIRLAVALEKKCYDFYRKGAMMAPDQAGREIFERLASEEAGHIDALRAESPEPWCDVQRLDQQPGMDGRLSEPQGKLLDQLRLALLNRQFSIDLYATLAKSFREPSISRVFEMTLLIARKELRSIRQEYLQADAIPAAPNITRRQRRTHVRSGLIPAIPNKHSQLFFSLLDSGRHPNLG